MAEIQKLSTRHRGEALYYIIDMSEFCAYACIQNPLAEVAAVMITPNFTHHRLDIRMWYGIKFSKFELEIWADVDVGTFVLRTVAVLGRGED